MRAGRKIADIREAMDSTAASIFQDFLFTFLSIEKSKSPPA